MTIFPLFDLNLASPKINANVFISETIILFFQLSLRSSTGFLRDCLIWNHCHLDGDDHDEKRIRRTSTVLCLFLCWNDAETDDQHKDRMHWDPIQPFWEVFRNLDKFRLLNNVWCFFVRNLGPALAKCAKKMSWGGNEQERFVRFCTFFMIKNAQGEALIYSAVIDTKII